MQWPQPAWLAGAFLSPYLARGMYHTRAWLSPGGLPWNRRGHQTPLIYCYKSTRPGDGDDPEPCRLGLAWILDGRKQSRWGIQTTWRGHLWPSSDYILMYLHTLSAALSDFHGEKRRRAIRIPNPLRVTRALPGRLTNPLHGCWEGLGYHSHAYE